MIAHFRFYRCGLPLLVAGGCLVFAQPGEQPPRGLHAGAAVVDISPDRYPVRVNGSFTERSADRLVDPLFARAVALDDGTTRLVLCVVDSCMVPRDLIDAAKEQASAATGIPLDHLLVSATHTHSAPAAMGCLGSRIDPEYAAMLPGKIAEAMVAATRNLQPARIGWTAFDDWDHTHNRRWIRRPDRLMNDPFGVPNVRAHMHPGHQSPDVTGPSGPVDPQLSLLAVETADGKPLALLANYSMHYQGSPMLSSDYFGRFAGHIGRLLGADDGFVGMMSQGTSGDLWSGDYSQPAKPALDYDAFGLEIATRVAAAYRTIEWRTAVPLAAAAMDLALDLRTPDESRLQWAREIAGGLGDALPQSFAEIYALEAIELHERQQIDVKLQALRVGDFGIAALPNEVFCLTGLKLKARSPFPLTMNITLANGADGYIPPPEQHALGGYTTWPARTAGLEVGAEPKITEALCGLLEQVSGKKRRTWQPVETSYAAALSASEPLAWWRLEEMDAERAVDEAGVHDAAIEPGVAVFLPGMGLSESPRSTPPSRAFHFAGGRLAAEVPLGDSYSISFWLWNGLPADARPVTGYAISRGTAGDEMAGEHFGIGGTHQPEAQGRLILYNGNGDGRLLAGKTPLASKVWHHVVLVREGGRVRVHLDGRAVPDLEGELPVTIDSPGFFIGGRADGFSNWEGKLDEVAIHARALAPAEIESLFDAAGMEPAVAFQPLPPDLGLASIHVPDGFRVELVACEPAVIDPVAIDWDLDGRLWVVEMADYPNGMADGKPGGRIRVLEDTDGDGRFEKSTLFADNLNFPTGLLTWRDGVIVTAAPDILFLRDTTGDGRADHTQVLISGLSEGNQQLRANGLRWGLDHRVYCAAGGHHGGHAADTVLRSHQDQQEVGIGSRDFSFDPDLGDVRPESGPSQFGRDRDDHGQWFGTQNSRALWHFVLADRYLRRNPYVPAPDPTQLVVGPLNAPVYPLSPAEKRFHSFENANHFTSACSGMIYRDELLWPRRENELDAFTCEPFHNLVQHNLLLRDGVSYRAERPPGEEAHDFFASTDRWCRPVMARTGPDGALWVVDMYRYMIEHPAWLPEEGRAETLPHYRLGEDKGRIYRIVPADTVPRDEPPPSRLKPLDLIAALDSPNGWCRDKAQMEFHWRWRGDAAGWPGFSENERDESLAALRNACESGNPLTRLHAFSTLVYSTGDSSAERLIPRLADSSPALRQLAMQAAEGIGDEAVIHAAAALAEDPVAAVRLQFAISAGEWQPRETVAAEVHATVGAALAKVAVRDHADPWLRAAVMSSAVPHFRGLAEGIAAAGGPAFESYAEDLVRLAVAMGEPGSLAAILRRSRPDDAAEFSAARLRRFARVLDLLQEKPALLAAATAGSGDLAAAMADAGDLAAFARGALQVAEASPALREAAAALLLRLAVEKEFAGEIVRSWLAPGEDQALQLAAVGLLAAIGDGEMPGALVNRLPMLTPATRDAAVDVLLSREAWSLALLEHVATTPETALDATRRARLMQHSSEDVRALAARVLAPDPAREAVLAAFRPALMLAGDPARGKVVFGARCIACHQSDQAGVGPDLKSVAGHPGEKLLTNIIDPSLDVQPGFSAFQATLRDGDEIYGILTSETGNSVTFKLPDGTSRLVLRSDLTALKSSGRSLMPDGLEAGLTHQEMADLIAWLQSGGG